MSTLPLSQWLSADRPDHTVVARRAQNDITLKKLRQDVLMLHFRLRQQPELRWALCFNDSYQFFVALLATLHGAKIPVLLGHNRPAQLIGQSEHFDGVLSDLPLMLRCPILQVSESALGANYVSDSYGCIASLPAVAKSAFITLFTSGSTGAPRRVDKPVLVMDREASWLASLWGPRANGCLVRASVSHQHLYGLTFRVWLPLSLALPFECEMVEFPEQLAGQQPYLFISSPAFLRRLDGNLTLPYAQLVVSAGGPLPEGSAAFAHWQLGVAIDEIYGSTETGIVASRVNSHKETPWQPFAGVSFIAEAAHSWRVCSELVPDSQGIVLDDHLEFDASGNFTLGERRDRVVKIEEKRISLSDIERRLVSLEGIEEAAVLTVQRGQRLCIGAVVVLNTQALDTYLQHGRRALTLNFRTQLADWLEPVALPRYWRVINEIPVNQQSKRSWLQLQELFNETH